MLFALRHGERADYAGPDELKKIDLSYDPHLTELGKIQARKAGDKIVNLIKDVGTNPNELKYLIISSPFRRCIQTAFHVSQALPKENILGQTIHLDDFLCDYLYYLPEDVLKNLQSRIDLDEVKKHVELDIQDGFPGPGEHSFAPKHPEGSAGIHQRVSEGFSKVKPYYLNEVNKEGNVVLILVTHGYVVECILELFNAFDKTKGLKFACLSQVIFDKNDGKGEVLVGQYHEHLHEADQEYKLRHPHHY